MGRLTGSHSYASASVHHSRDVVTAPASHRKAAERARIAVEAAAAKLGRDLAVLDVGEILAITDYFVLVSAANTRQVRTIVEEIEKVLRESDGSRPLGVEGLDDATWVLLDFGDVVVHVFLDETREYYDLDRLWADVPRTEVDAAGPR